MVVMEICFAQAQSLKNYNVDYIWLGTSWSHPLHDSEVIYIMQSLQTLKCNYIGDTPTHLEMYPLTTVSERIRKQIRPGSEYSKGYSVN